MSTVEHRPASGYAETPTPTTSLLSNTISQLSPLILQPAHHHGLAKIHDSILAMVFDLIVADVVSTAATSAKVKDAVAPSRLADEQRKKLALTSKHFHDVVM